MVVDQAGRPITTIGRPPYTAPATTTMSTSTTATSTTTTTATAITWRVFVKGYTRWLCCFTAMPILIEGGGIFHHQVGSTV